MTAESPLLPLATLQHLWPHGDQHIPGLIEGIVAAAPIVLPKYGITNGNTAAVMFGQFSHECGAGLEMVENLNYSADGLLRTWPRHFTQSMAQHYAHNPQMIAEIAYGGRMGNAPPPSHDGWNYRGQGLSQVTGKEGYEKLDAFLKAHGADYSIVDNPELIISPQYTLECGVADFIVCGCLPFAQKGDILNTTKHLNGGTIGLAERIRWTAKWRQAIGNVQVPIPAAPAAAPAAASAAGVAIGVKQATPPAPVARA